MAYLPFFIGVLSLSGGLRVVPKAGFEPARYCYR